MGIMQGALDDSYNQWDCFFESSRRRWLLSLAPYTFLLTHWAIWLVERTRFRWCNARSDWPNAHDFPPLSCNARSDWSNVHAIENGGRRSEFSYGVSENGLLPSHEASTWIIVVWNQSGGLYESMRTAFRVSVWIPSANLSQKMSGTQHRLFVFCFTTGLHMVICSSSFKCYANRINAHKLIWVYKHQRLIANYCICKQPY